jgi:membrane associated rhomboid family serine protease
LFLPVGDEPNYAYTRPWGNWGLIATNVLVFVVLRLSGGADGYQETIVEWGFTPVAPTVATVFSSMFLHADLMHLGGNMLFLWIFGDNVEGRLGHLGYLFAYLAFGVAAVLFFRLLGPGSTLPLIGASGAILGVEGFYFVAFGRNRVKVFYWFFWVIVGVRMISARVVLGISFLFNLFYMLAAGGHIGGGVAYAAHVGGFLVGLLLALALRPFAPRDEMS